MEGIYKVTFKGDHFVFTIVVEAKVYDAKPRASDEILDRYGFDVTDYVCDTDVVQLDPKEAFRCLSCKGDFAVRNGTLCSDCFRSITSDYFAEFTK
jgi:hypothetical protein